MASHVTVIDTSARRAVVKTTPGKYLSDVLQEACTRLGLNASQYGLKNNNKPIDLSRNIRLSGLSSGAKLELIQLSRSPSVVSVALQLPESEALGVQNGRLTDKFPSTTTLWLVLRKFETDGAGASRNLTARSLPKIEAGISGGGRLFYETPILQIVGRELSSFPDLQKTLGQLGFNSGNVMIRLSFRSTELPLEEAMSQIDQYFKALEGQETRGADAGSAGETSLSNPSRSPKPDEGQPHQSPPQTQTDVPSPQSPPSHASQASDSIVTGPMQRPISVFAPPSSTTPLAARQQHNDADYEPTVDHAKHHQTRLAASTRNKRLPTDAEIDAAESSQATKLSAVRDVEIKIRFPDQSSVVSHFSSIDTVSTLYEFAEGVMERDNEPFWLKYSGPNGEMKTIERSKGGERLIGGLGMMGRVLVNFGWDEKASLEARGPGPVLKEAYREKAREIEINDFKAVDIPETAAGGRASGEKGKEKEGGKDRKGGVPKWLKLPGKK